ncbi:MAG: hypothetical protein AB2L18_12140 [Anaerolineaceae bacterium]
MKQKENFPPAIHTPNQSKALLPLTRAVLAAVDPVQTVIKETRK